MTIDFEDGARPFASLEAEFQAACDAAIEECKTLTPPYNPTAWIGMARQLGAAEAARRLVVSGDVQTGFERLARAGRPELTIEWAILDRKWDPLFSEQHRELLGGGCVKPASNHRGDRSGVTPAPGVGWRRLAADVC